MNDISTIKPIVRYILWHDFNELPVYLEQKASWKNPYPRLVHGGDYNKIKFFKHKGQAIAELHSMCPTQREHISVKKVSIYFHVTEP